MSKAEKIFDKTMGTLLFVVVITAIILGIIKLAPETPKLITPSKKYKGTITIECVRCGWKNNISQFQFNDTVRMDSTKTFYDEK